MGEYVNYIVIAVVAVIIAAIIVYLRREKKRGSTCIGCPYSKQCSGKCAGHSASETR